MGTCGEEKGGEWEGAVGATNVALLAGSQTCNSRLAKVVDELGGGQNVHGRQVLRAGRVVVIAVDRKHGQADVEIGVLKVDAAAHKVLTLVRQNLKRHRTVAHAAGGKGSHGSYHCLAAWAVVVEQISTQQNKVHFLPGPDNGVVIASAKRAMHPIQMHPIQMHPRDARTNVVQPAHSRCEALLQTSRRSHSCVHRRFPKRPAMISVLDINCAQAAIFPHIRRRKWQHSCIDRQQATYQVIVSGDQNTQQILAAVRVRWNGTCVSTNVITAHS